MTVKTRFAPSPTGYLHMGSARTALFNWLYARHHGGIFVLRIEDTDLERSRKEYEEEILESLRWLGLDWDGVVEYQSKRFEVYRKTADRLLKEDKAYAEGEALRFRSPKVRIGWEDIVRGRIEFDGNLLDDLVIMKSDGSPTYNFACVCDDGEMGITHVIRGEDHISNTPKQIPLYDALGYAAPKFAHIPLILGEDRSRLSKRHGATSVREFKGEGYLSEAVVNYLSLLGWSPGNDQEILTQKELIEKFTVERVLSTGAIFSKQKMDWMNGEYLRMKTNAELEHLFFKALADAGIDVADLDTVWRGRFVELYRKRIFVLKDLAEEARFFFCGEVSWNEEGETVLRGNPKMPEAFDRYADRLEALRDFSHDAVEAASREFMKEMGLSGKQFIHPARVAVTGRLVSPGFFETLSLLGKDKTVHRLRSAARKLIPA